MLLVVVILSSPAVWSAQLFTPTLSPGNILNIHLSSISPNNKVFFTWEYTEYIYPALASGSPNTSFFSSDTYLVSLYSSSTVPFKRIRAANQSSSMNFLNEFLNFHEMFFSFFLLVLNLGKSKHCKGL